VNDTNRSFKVCPGERLCFARVEIYVKTYGKADLLAASDQLRNKKKGPSPQSLWRIIPQASLSTLLALRPAIVADHVRKIQILNDDGEEESALAAYWILDGINRCCIGFLQRHLVKHREEYDGRIAQIVEFYKDAESETKRKQNYKNLGCCQAVLIDTVGVIKLESSVDTKSKITEGDETCRPIKKHRS
jgi:hypothetical protein